MQEPTPDGVRAIEYANAHVSAILATAESAIEMLIEGPESDNPDLARAVKAVLDSQTEILEYRLKMLEKAVIQNHPNPEDRVAPASNTEYTVRINGLTQKYQEHITTRLPEILEDTTPTEESTFYTMMAIAIAHNQAARRLAREIATMKPGDPERLGYTDALLEVTTQLSGQSESLQKDIWEPDTYRKERLVRQAREAARDTKLLEELHQGQGPEEQEQEEVPYITLGLIALTLQGVDVIISKEGAQEMARAWDTELYSYEEHPGGEIRAQMEGAEATITVTRAGEETPAGSDIVLAVYEQEITPKEEFERAAALLKLATSRAVREGPQEEIPLKTRMCMDTDRIPEGYTDKRMKEPVSKIFLTESGKRCLNAITWERDDGLEQLILEDEGEVVNCFMFWSESLTTVKPDTTEQELLEILMATYAVGAQFMLQEHMDGPEENETENQRDC